MSGLLCIDMMSVVNAASASAVTTSDLTTMFSTKNHQNLIFKDYPKHWVGQYKNKAIAVNFTQLDGEKAKGYYQLDGKVTTFQVRCYITKLPHLYKLVIEDKNVPVGRMTFWLDVRDQKTLVIDKSLRSNVSKTIQFSLKSE